MDIRALKKQWEDASWKGRANPTKGPKKRPGDDRRALEAALPLRRASGGTPLPRRASEVTHPTGGGPLDKGKGPARLNPSDSHPIRIEHRGKEKVVRDPSSYSPDARDGHPVKRRREDGSADARLQGLYALSGDLPPGSTSIWNIEDVRAASLVCDGLVDLLDLERGRSKSVCVLFDAQYAAILQSISVAKMLHEHFDECKVELTAALKEVETLKVANKQLEIEKAANVEEKARLTKDVARFEESFERECRTGARFLQSDNWSTHKAKLERDAVEAFKGSSAYEEALMSRVVAFYGEIVAQCQETLRESGKVGEDIICLLDPPGGGEVVADGEDAAPNDEEMVDYGDRPPADPQ